MDEAFSAWRKMSRIALTICISCFGLAAACAGIEDLPPKVVVNAGSPVAAAPAPAAAPSAVETIATEPPGSELKEEIAAAPSLPVKSESTAKVVAATAKAPAKAAVSPVAIEQPRKNADPLPVAKTPEPTLDVAGLTARLRDTKAIGVFTKLALKNQVDDLLKQFRTHYQSGQKTDVASLRQPYDMLVLKVLALVQDSDPSLARTISGSREAIWGILADPDKFKTVA
jgi:hypothetical protein